MNWTPMGLISNMAASYTEINISLATYDSVSFLLSGQDTVIEGILLSPDGGSMFISGDSTNRVYQYTLSTPWDLATASYSSKSLDLSGQDTSPQGIFFSPDGLNLFTVGNGSDTIYQYTLTTPFDLSTASYSLKSKLVSGQDTTPQSIFFKSDGLRMFMLGSTNDRIYQYTLTTAWDITTATYDSVFFSVASEETNPQVLHFLSDGQTLLVMGTGNDRVFQYVLTTDWDISSAVYTGLSKLVSGQDSNPSGIFIGNNGSKMYMCGDTNNRAYQYSL